MKVIEDKQDRFGNFPIWFNSHNLRDINDYLQHHYDGYKFAIVIDCTLGEIAPLEKPLPVYFFGDIAEEVAQEADKKLVDKKEYEGLTKKQIPQKPVYGYDEQDEILCPVCKENVGQMDDYYFGRNKYCPECGQRIDWE